jgi:thioredoxin reductase (NADPH)
MDAMREQAVRVGTEVRINTIESVDLSNRPFTVKADDGTTVLAKTLIICTGASAKWIGIESEVALQNRGVSACATCDGFFFRGKDVIVVGGGDTAMEEAMYLTRMCNSVTVIHRRDTLRASKVMADRALANPKIRFEWNSAVKEIKDVTLGKVTGVVLESTIDGSTKDLACDGVFVAIGHQPNTGLFKDQLPMDANGYLVTDGVKTNVDGCFAAGDVWDTHYRQAVTAAGMGCQAAIDAIRFIEANEH